MFTKPYLAIVLLFILIGAAFGQTPTDDGRGVLPKPEDPNGVPKNVKEMLDKMKIEDEKKDYDEMIDRGDQVLKRSQELEKAFNSKSGLTVDQRTKLDGIEKLVKKIRGELGGNDTDESESADALDLPPTDEADAIKKLPKLASRMVDELKKTTRFSISAAAIENTNAVLRVVRFLRGK